MLRWCGLGEKLRDGYAGDGVDVIDDGTLLCLAELLVELPERFAMEYPATHSQVRGDDVLIQAPAFEKIQ